MRGLRGWSGVLLWLLLMTLLGSSASAKAADATVVSADIGRFWRAYDAIRAEPDAGRQRVLLQRLFLDPGSDGLRAFMQAKGYDADCYLDSIRDHPRFWDSVRPRTLALARRGQEFAPSVARFRALYPALRPAGIYFLIGCLRSSGTTLDDKVLIGAELASGDAGVDVSELPERTRKGLGAYFASAPAQQLVLLNIHEYVHTQQRGPGTTLLAQAMYEGAADFVAEQATGQVPTLPYMRYGPQHEAALKREFQSEMHGSSWSGWLYNGAGGRHGVGDLGYYIGYAMMRDHHARATDKAQALRDIIELDYRDQAAVERFAAASGFFAPDAALPLIDGKRGDALTAGRGALASRQGAWLTQ